MTPTLDFWVSIRQALLTAVDAVERLVNAGLRAQSKPPKFEPRTAELRKVAKITGAIQKEEWEEYQRWKETDFVMTELKAAREGKRDE